MEIQPAKPVEPDRKTRDFYVDCLRTLDRADLPYLVGGGYAMAYYTGIARNTKDLDIFIRPRDRDRSLEILAGAGYRTEHFYPFWISKAIGGDAFVDILYNSGNGLSPVDDEWFEHATEVEVLGYRTRLAPAEEQLWSKAFVQDRDRYDGADVIHLILAQGERFDWQRVLRRFRSHEHVLLAHLVLFNYTYPSERRCVPQWVMDRLFDVVKQSPADANTPICRGPFLAQKSYGIAMDLWGFKDARLRSHGGPLRPEEVAQLPKE